jgi:hypothetical protein
MRRTTPVIYFKLTVNNVFAYSYLITVSVVNDCSLMLEVGISNRRLNLYYM